jgi:AcrR family transcriptional regulator
MSTATREERRLAVAELNRTRLLDAAEEVFGREGFHGTTLKEVAALAGFAVGSVYSFFDGKDDLFRQLFVRRGEEFMALQREVLSSGEAAAAQLHRLVDVQVGFFRDHRRFARLYLRYSSPVLLSPDRRVDVVVAERFDEAMALQADLFRRGQAAGEFRSGDPAVLARLFSGLVSAYQSVEADAEPAPVAMELEELHAVVRAAFSP